MLRLVTAPRPPKAILFNLGIQTFILLIIIIIIIIILMSCSTLKSVNLFFQIVSNRTVGQDGRRGERHRKYGKSNPPKNLYGSAFSFSTHWSKGTNKVVRCSSYTKSIRRGSDYVPSKERSQSASVTLKMWRIVVNDQSINTSLFIHGN